MMTLEIPKFFKGTDYKTELRSFQWGLQKNVAVGGQTGQGKFLPAHDVYVSMEVDEFTAEFYRRFIHGENMAKVSIKFHKSDGASGSVPYLEIILTDVFVSSIHYGGGEKDNPVVFVGLSFKEGEFKQL